MNTNILDKFTANYKLALGSAYELSLVNNKKIELLDIFWGLYKSKGSLANEVLAKTGIKQQSENETQANHKIKINMTEMLADKKEILPQEIKKIIIKSVNLSVKHNHKYIGTEHLLYSLIAVNDKKINSLLEKNNIKPNTLLRHLDMILNSTSHFSDMAQAMNALKEKIDQKQKNKKTKKEEILLDFFATCLTDKEIQKNISPVIGRQSEINRIIQILSRKNKNNPILLGDPGVGKTAIIEGLAKKILEYDVPNILLNKKIYSLDIPLLVAGTSFRGEFEARIKQIVDEVKNNQNIILFIDEIHNIIGAGSASGTMDAANILKPALARGEIRCIGATTYDDFRKHIEGDAALTRRFQPVKINEPSSTEAIAIIKGIKNSFIKHHGIDISDEAIEQAVFLSERYITDQFLPDKAIDLIDEAAARKKLLEPSDNNYKKIISLENNLEEVIKQKKHLIFEEKYKEALEIKTKELELINKIYLAEGEQLKNNIKPENLSRRVVMGEDITAITAEAIKINLPNTKNSRHTLKNLKKTLKKQIIGQDKILDELINTLKRSAVGLTGEKRPLGSFVFAGPSGVGKTYTAEVLANTFFQGKESLIRIDMSEFAEKFNISKLLGAPAGYIGYGEGGTLTEKIRRNPYSVVLFDEIEKAHPDLFNLLLQILEDGHLTDAKGKITNFKNSIIIMTTNIGLKKSKEKESLGFENGHKRSTQDDFIENIENFLRPELLNRIDQILVFNTLAKKDIKKIIAIELANINKNLNNKNLRIAWTNEVTDVLTNDYDEDQGARQIRKILREKIENPLAEKIIGQKIKKGITHIEIIDNKIVIS